MDPKNQNVKNILKLYLESSDLSEKQLYMAFHHVNTAYMHSK